MTDGSSFSDDELVFEFPLEELHDVISVEVTGPMSLRLEFDDGLIRNLNLTPLLGPAFEEILKKGIFDQVFVDEKSGTIAWPTGMDIAPETLYMGHWNGVSLLE